MLSFKLIPGERLYLLGKKNLPLHLSKNVNGPSVYIDNQNSCKNFNLFFADHRGKHIRKAVSSDIFGPYKLKSVLELDINNLSSFTTAHNHIASPFVFKYKNNLWMVVHAPCTKYDCQRSFFFKMKNSKWEVIKSDYFLPFYSKALILEDNLYFFSKGGDVFKSQDPIGPYDFLGNIFNINVQDKWHNYDNAARHFGLFHDKKNDILLVCFSRIGIIQESIEYILIKTLDFKKGIFSNIAKSKILLSPIEKWEGACLAKTKSKAGASDIFENALRDPEIISFENSLYLFYSFGGERGIGVTKIAEFKELR